MPQSRDSQIAAAIAANLDPAVLYLRVSTKRQLDTAVDIDPDGNSIATQRKVGHRRADGLGAAVVKEFVEPYSAKTVDDRKVFRELLAFIQANPEIKYLIVYMRSRAFRNRFDAAIVEVQLKKLGVRLISVKEDFGEGPYAMAMEGMLDIMNDLQNTLQGLDIQTKMMNKAVGGGTLGRAKLGYLNVRIDYEGKQINTIALDPERAPLVRKAWELYATNEYTIERLEATMADLGLTARPTARWPAQRPVSGSKLHAMLSDPYYAGHVVYKGQIYPGRHEPIVSQELFDQVQDVLNIRSARGQRDRVLQCYLKGALFCQRCHLSGRTARLIYTEPVGRNGTRYAYFLCRGRQDGVCDLPHLRAELVEEAIIDHYATLQLPADFATELRALMQETLNDEQTSTREHHASLSRRLRTIDERESRLIDLAADGTMPQAKIRAKLHDLRIERERTEASLGSVSDQLAVGAAVLRDALHLLEDPQTLYRAAPDNVRRHLNQAYYERFYLDDLEVADDDKTPIFAELHEVKRTHKGRQVRSAGCGQTPPRQQKSPRNAEASCDADSLTLPSVFSVTGSSKGVMVGLTGFEPATT
ncbi:recombinase family protein [Nocardia caishijiensis]|uniref:recombinase family protein n=1 Tax=Nocardia caishijiensis TaxID=184756 RepID=UPI000A05519D|nr:recombinase family protein [Nocardia caishijiensis]